MTGLVRSGPRSTPPQSDLESGEYGDQWRGPRTIADRGPSSSALRSITAATVLRRGRVFDRDAMSREPTEPGLASLMLVVHGSVTATSTTPETRDVAPLTLEICVATTPTKPRRNSTTRGWFAVTVIGETAGGERGRYTFPVGDHATTRDLWRALRAQGFEAGWHRAEAIPDPPPGVRHVPDLEQFWKTTATTPRLQLELKCNP